MIKLRPGSAICLQDTSFRDMFHTPAIPTMFGTIDRMQWREDGYQVATVGTHVYSPDGHNVEFEHLCFVAIPIEFVDVDYYIPTLAQNTLGQSSIGGDNVVPPLRIGRGLGFSFETFETRSMRAEERSEAVRNWVDEQHRLEWL